MAGMEGTSVEIGDGADDRQAVNHSRRGKVRRYILPLYS
jgi:hypothetical protein